MPQRDLDSSPTATRFERLTITAHGSQTARRLAWRFAETGLEIKSCDFTEAAHAPLAYSNTDLIIADLGTVTDASVLQLTAQDGAKSDGTDAA